jgi:prohibitin 2
MGILFFLLFIASLVGAGFLSIKHELDTKSRNWGFKFYSKRAIAPVLAGVVFLALSLGITSVDAGNIGIVKRFGQPIRQLNPGVHLVMPIADDVTNITVQTRIVKPSEDASSHDLQMVHTEVTFAFHVDPQYATSILVNLNGEEVDRVIVPAILEAIKATTAKYDVQQLITQRAEVRDGIESFVKERLTPYHVVAETTSITDFRFSQDFEAAIEAKVTAQQLFEKSQNDLKRIQIEADQKVAAAKGEAEALRVQKEQITPELIQLRTVEMMSQKWDGKLPEVIVGGSQALPMMDVLQAARNARHPEQK